MSDQQGIQRCKMEGCNTALIPLVPEHAQKKQELYCTKCHLSYSRYSDKLRKLLPHVYKQLNGQ